VVRNGAAFESMIREREGENAKFSFLRDGGEGADYYRFRVWSQQQGLPEEDVEAMLAEAFPPPPADEQAEFHALHAQLNGSKDSIRALRSWIIDRPHFVDWVCEILWCARAPPRPAANQPPPSLPY